MIVFRPCDLSRELDLLELDTLSERQFSAVVDGNSHAAHVLLPAVRTGFATSTSLLFTTKGATNFSAVRGQVDVDETAVRATSTVGPHEDVAHVVGEQAAAETLRHGVVEFNGLLESLELDDVQDRHEELLLDDRGVGRGGDQSGFDEVTLDDNTGVVLDLTLEDVAAHEDLAALFLDGLQTVLVLLDGVGSVERTHSGALFQRIADANLLVGSLQGLDE